MTKKWAGWEAEQGDENCKGLAKLTKGYGGADLRVRLQPYLVLASVLHMPSYPLGVVYGSSPERDSKTVPADLPIE